MPTTEDNGRGYTATLTAKQRRALEQAAERERGSVCPLRNGLHANAETAFLEGLARRGLIDMNGICKGAPSITEAGRAAIAKAVSP